MKMYKVGDAIIYQTIEASQRIGKSKDTILRAFRMKKVEDVSRDRNGHRVWTDTDIERVREYFIKNSRRSKDLLFKEED